MDAQKDGKGGFIFQPQALKITQGNDKHCWNIPKTGPAELIKVCWLEVTATTENLTPGNKYEVSFKVSLTNNAFGWDNSPIFLMAKIGKKGKYLYKKAMLSERGASSDKEFKIPLGDDSFVIEVPSDFKDTKLYFGLYEVWSGEWKGGLKVHQATVQKLPVN